MLPKILHKSSSRFKEVYYTRAPKILYLPTTYEIVLYHITQNYYSQKLYYFKTPKILHEATSNVTKLYYVY
jgi:hypothetical protein